MDSLNDRFFDFSFDSFLYWLIEGSLRCSYESVGRRNDGEF